MSAQHSFSHRVKMLGLGMVFGFGMLAAAAPAAQADPPAHAPAWGYRRKQATRYTNAPRFYRTDRNGRSYYTDRYGNRVYRSRVRGYRSTYRSPYSVWQDSDQDGIPNRRDRDADNDGIRNRRDRDDDNDGIPDRRDRRDRRISGTRYRR